MNNPQALKQIFSMYKRYTITCKETGNQIVMESTSLLKVKIWVVKNLDQDKTYEIKEG